MEIVGLTDSIRKTVVTGVEMFRKLLDQAVAGDNIGASQKCSEEQKVKGPGFGKTGSIKPFTKFKGQVYV